MPEIDRPAARQLSRCCSTIGPAEDLVGPDAAVVATLGGRETGRREAEGPAALEERVLLLEAEQGLLGGELLGDAPQLGPGVGGVRGHVGEEHLAQHQDVVAAPDRVRADERPAGARSQTPCPAPGWSRSRRSPRCPARCRRRGPSSSTAASPWARSRRSRCTPPCRPCTFPSFRCGLEGAPGRDHCAERAQP